MSSSARLWRWWASPWSFGRSSSSPPSGCSTGGRPRPRARSPPWRRSAPRPAGSRIGKTYRPVVSFVDQDGKRVDFTSPDGYAPPRHRPGGTVDVDYDPKRPDQARLAGSGVGLLPLGCVALGLVAFALSAVLFLVPT